MRLRAGFKSAKGLCVGKIIHVTVTMDQARETGPSKKLAGSHVNDVI